MARQKKAAANASRGNSTGANLGFEVQLCAAADALRNNMDAAEYKHVVLGLIFLKYISDAFEAHHAVLEAQTAEGADPEDPDEYRAVRIFWVPKEARWPHLKAQAPQPTIGTLIDDAMAAIERDNVSPKGVLPKDYARPGLDKQHLGQLINLVSDIALGAPAERARTPWDGSMSTSCPSLRAPRASKVASSIPPATWCASWSRCSPPTRAGSMTPAAARAGCSSKARNSSRPTAAGLRISLSMARSPTTPPGGWPR